MSEKKFLNETVSRQAKEILLQQRGIVIWITGLSGSGKSTLAHHLEIKLHKAGFLTTLLDGDTLRSGLNATLGFSNEDRTENIRRAAEVAKILVGNGIVTICSFISPTQEIRQMAREIIGAENFFDVYLECSFDACANRDVKGLYKKALSGEIKNFTGLDAPFEIPENPWLKLNTELYLLTESVQELTKAVLPLIDHPTQNSAI